MPFGSYAKYYNLLYRDKDYESEAKYIHNLIQKHIGKANSILDLGCGTGRHDLILANNGYKVFGIDASDFMIEEAQKILDGNLGNKAAVKFTKGDIRSVRVGSTFDVVVSLFHVMSYQVTNNDIISAFTTARLHLNKSGIFIFDCWYGPAVLASRPEVRIKRLNEGSLLLTRIAEPSVDVNANTVDVNYTILLLDTTTGKTEELHETHKMRYYFIPEISFFLSTAGFELLNIYAWMLDAPPDEKNWGAVFVAKPKQGINHG